MEEGGAGTGTDSGTGTSVREGKGKAKVEKPLRPPTLLRRIVNRLAIELGYLVLRLLSLTWRSRGDMSREAKRAPITAAFPHGRIGIFVWAWRNLEGRCLISRHHDGDVMAGVASRFGFVPIRGSSTRGGREALDQAIADNATFPVGFTPDGPRGPRYVFARGFVECAAQSGRPVLLCTASCDRAWILPTWDRAMIPKPFARIYFWYEVTAVGRDLDPEACSRVAAELEARVKERTRELDRRFGWPEDPALSADPEVVRACHEDEARARQERRARRRRRGAP